MPEDGGGDGGLRRRRGQKIWNSLMALPLWAAALLSVLMMAGPAGFILLRGLPELWRLASLGEDWLISCAVNTALLLLLALLPAMPLAAGAAAWLVFFAPTQVQRPVRALLEAVSGLPSILFGMFGYLLFGSALGLRYSVLTGALTLAVMLLPGAVLSFWEAFSQVERPLLESALGLGAGLGTAVRTVVVPAASAGLLAGVLGLAQKVVGESAALIFTSGAGTSARGLFARLWESGATFSVQLYRLVLGGENGPAFGTAALLLLLSAVLSAGHRIAAGRGRRKL